MTKLMPPSSFTMPDKADTQSYVRLARNAEEIASAQRLRYQVFYEECGARPTAEMKMQQRDFDDFDSIADHLIVIIRDTQTQQEKIIGTYRLLRQDIAEKHNGFYAAGEYDIQNLLKSGKSLLELGRSCVLPDYRTKLTLNLLWQGIAEYVTEHNVDVLFGCASFPGVDVANVSKQLSYLHHFHTTTEALRPIALAERYLDMDMVEKATLDERRIFASLPPLIKGYLRVGATVGDGAVIDPQFNTIDICILAQTRFITARYRKYFEHKIQKTLPGEA